MVVLIAFLLLLINIPFGFWRGSTRKYSLAWFVSIHLPVFISIYFRHLAEIEFDVLHISVFVLVFIGGQWLGNKIYLKYKDKIKSDHLKNNILMKNKKAFVLINLGTPNQPTKKEVSKYLFQFLNDSRVIDIPWLARKFLVNLIIIPFRLGKSTRLYQELWTSQGSLLSIYLNSLADKLNLKIGDEYQVFKAMRYGQPSLKTLMGQLEYKGFEEIVFFPLFPQYASSTTGSISEKVFKEMKRWEAIPTIKLINQFYNHPEFIQAFSNRIANSKPEKYDHIIFSYHGLPIRHINKIHPQTDHKGCSCENEMPEHGNLCYKATCYETTRLLINKLNISEDKISIGFQSRLSKNWVAPFTDELIINLAKRGTKKVLVVAPSFVADCLETIVEIDREYRDLFIENGGEELKLVESLNDKDIWVDAMAKML